MTPIRKELLRRLGYIGLAVIVAVTQTLMDDSKPYRYISVAAILFILFHFIKLVKKSQLIIDDFFPPKVETETTTTSANKIINSLSMVLFFCGLLAIIFESNSISNTIHGTKFFWSAGVIGIILFVIVIAFFKIKFPTVFDESSRRYSVYFGYLFGLFLVVPATASYINKSCADQRIDCKNFLVSRKSSGGGRTTEYFIFGNYNGSDERFTVVKPLWDSIDENKIIQLCVRKGYWGYEYVTKFNLIASNTNSNGE
jgi:FtsH-binding integral membrane protein